MKKTTLITGSYGGLGKCLSLIHAEEGNNLILVGRSEEKLAEQANSLKEEFNIDVQTIAVNLALPEAAQTIYDTCKKNGWEVDYLRRRARYGRAYRQRQR